VLALVAVSLALVRPPAAYVDTGTVRVPLAISGWCWASRCGAPIAASRRVATVTRGATVKIELRFVPTQLHLAVGGVRVKPAVHGRELSWPATRGGGLSLTATGVQGFVTYVGRLALRS
jgi:hypothetical protein